MTNEEAKQAFFDETPVMSDGIRYKYISAVIYKKDANKNVIVSAELWDRCGHSTTIARVQDVSVCI